MRLIERQFISKIPQVGENRRVARRCEVCVPAERKLDAKAGQKRKRAGRETAYECGKCGKSVCVTPCFELYHTHLDYENA